MGISRKQLQPYLVQHKSFALPYSSYFSYGIRVNFELSLQPRTSEKCLDRDLYAYLKKEFEAGYDSMHQY